MNGAAYLLQLIIISPAGPHTNMLQKQVKANAEAHLHEAFRLLIHADVLRGLATEN